MVTTIILCETFIGTVTGASTNEQTQTSSLRIYVLISLHSLCKLKCLQNDFIVHKDKQSKFLITVYVNFSHDTECFDVDVTKRVKNATNEREKKTGKEKEKQSFSCSDTKNFSIFSFMGSLFVLAKNPDAFKSWILCIALTIISLASLNIWVWHQKSSAFKKGKDIVIITHTPSWQFSSAFIKNNNFPFMKMNGKIFACNVIWAI